MPLRKALVLNWWREEREGSIFVGGYRYLLRDQDTTWPVAYGSVRRDMTRGSVSTTWPTGMVSRMRFLVAYLTLERGKHVGKHIDWAL